MVDFPLKVKFSDIDKPLCYGLYNQEQYKNDTEASYLLYSDPLTGKILRHRQTTVLRSIQPRTISERHRGELSTVQ